MIRLKSKHVAARPVVADVVLGVAPSWVVVEGVSAAQKERVAPDELSIVASGVAEPSSIVLHLVEPIQDS